MSVSLYVYYRVAPDQLHEASTAVRKAIERIRQRTGITGRLMTRVGEPLLWMEIYEDIADREAFLDAMENSVELSAFSRFLDDGQRRHTEMFQPAMDH